MIEKTITIAYNVDEQTNIGVLGGKYIKFMQETAEDGSITETPVDILPADVMNEYVAMQVKVPEEFAEVREAVQTKINALQAVL